MLKVAAYSLHYFPPAVVAEVEKSDTNGSDMYSVAPLAALLGVTEMDLSKVVEGTMVISPNMLLEVRRVMRISLY